MKERFETFTVLINKISRSIKKLKNQEMAEYGLHSTHVSCLYHLYTANSLTATELSERCEEDKATISRSVDFLEENGFCFCESKSAKRYNSPIMLTDKGRLVGQEISKKVNSILDQVGEGLSDPERVEFYRCLGIICENLEKAANCNG